jgi:hypothetical protein
MLPVLIPCGIFPACAILASVMAPSWSAALCWRLFEATGSVWAYLGYRQCLRAITIGWLSLN